MQSKILDIHGNPFVFDDEIQTENNSQLGYLQQHYSEHPTSGLTPARAASILRAAEQGDLVSQAELAEDVEEKDTHLQSEIGKRRNAIQAVDWQIIAPRNATPEEQRDADMLNEILQDAVWLDDCIFDATDAILKGFSCQEIEWEQGLLGGLKLIRNVHWRDPAWFMTPTFERNNLRLRDGSTQGVDLQPFGWVKHIAKAKTGYLSRIGLVRSLVWPFIYKNYSARDFAEFLEIYGLPLRLGKYPEGATQNEKNTLLRAVMQIGHNAGGIIPRGMEIEFEKAAEGDSTAFMTMIEWAEKSMSKAILGGTLTSQADGASSTNALGNVHNEVRSEIRNADLKRLQATLTRDLVYPLYALNCKSFNDARRIPRFEFDISESEDIASFGAGLGALVDLGFRIPRQWAHDKLQVPVAADDEEILERKTVENPTALLHNKPNGKMAVLSVSRDPDDLIDELEPSDTDYQAMIEPMLKPVIDALQKGGYEYAQEQLATLYADMDDKQLEETLARAIFISDMLGRLNANR
ncbi:Mu-like prophage protein gp29 [[Actinobacillus] rossii]|uniref:Mu-like prophage protein gp29 n=1 Tax=[Actinobacillus] rossii TaxID=123820 RepID=A0A380TPG2_9PAST|nr:Mu-like prophage protein gp29 [[Actinobacillus] rossii]